MYYDIFYNSYITLYKSPTIIHSNYETTEDFSSLDITYNSYKLIQNSTVCNSLSFCLYTIHVYQGVIVGEVQTSNSTTTCLCLCNIIWTKTSLDKHIYILSVLPITSLILGRHVNLHLKAYLELYSLFYFRQSGFREHHACQTALIKIIDDCLSVINQNKLAHHYFQTFLKLLIHKFKLYNIDTPWFSSYLNKRFQQTHYACPISDKKEVISCVPQ